MSYKNRVRYTLRPRPYWLLRNASLHRHNLLCDKSLNNGSWASLMSVYYLSDFGGLLTVRRSRVCFARFLAERKA